MKKIFLAFVSSTFEDLQTERRVIADVLLNCNCFPRGMELFTANARKPWDVIAKEIKDCDFYLLLIGGRYGDYCRDKDARDRQISFTQREFEYADSLSKPIITFIHRNWRELPQDKKHIDWEDALDRADHVKQDKLDKFIALDRDNTQRFSAQ
jgi:sugar phosphate isomerase/epimerase